MASLRELQQSFAAALRDPAARCAVTPTAHLDIYRNNGRVAWRETLERAFPVVHRRVGDDYFRQLCVHYRERVPSRSGDLHDYAREFAGFLDEYLPPEYAWLADLARLEWARVECSVMEELAAIDAQALGGFPPARLESLVFALQPSLELHSYSYPVFSVWEANQVEDAPPVDQSLGAECGMVRIRHEYPEIRRLDPALFSFLYALAGGSTLGSAMTSAALDDLALTEALAFVFREGLVCSLQLKEIS